MNPEKVANVLNLNANERYGYFVRKVADMEAVWSLERSGWAGASDETGSGLIPFWPEESFAELCATGPWEGYSARSIQLVDFLAKWLPGMKRDGLRPAVFPTPGNKGVVVSSDQLREAIEAERAQYE